MKLPVKTIQGKDSGELEVKFALVEDGRGTQAVHDTVVAYTAAQRMGTACTKNAGEVAGTNKKPWRQKGTGRARAGSFQSPLWRGGGVVFGPKPRDFAKKVNSSTKQLALRKALTERIKSGDVTILDDLKLSSPKTKDFVSALSGLKITGKALIVVQAHDKNLELATRNVEDIEVCTGDELNTYQLLRPCKVLFTRGGYEAVEKRLAK